MQIDSIAARVKRLRAAASDRDRRMDEIRQVRAGDMAHVFPDLFPPELPRTVVANFIDTASRDLAELIAPLPTLTCQAYTTPTQKAKLAAAKKQNIGLFYWHNSKLEQNMVTSVDRYLTYGFLPFVVEPCFKTKYPRIRAEDPRGSYPVLDRYGDTIAFAKVWRMRCDDLAALFPEHEATIYRKARVGGAVLLGQERDSHDTELEVVKWTDDKLTILFLPERGNCVLERVEHGLGECPVVTAVRPGLDNEIRGQWDDVIGVQMARAKFGLLALEAAEKSVQAPLALPDDVNDFAVGSDAIIYSRNPEKIRRVGLEFSPAAFAESANLENELRKATRYPEGRSGQAEASVITGKGIQALLGTIDTQIKTAQTVLGAALRKATQIAFKMDEKTWPNSRKAFRAVVAGQPVSETYTPSKDIDGDYECDVTYGFAAGLGPNQAAVYVLQLLGADLIDKDTARRNLPMGDDPSKIERAVTAQKVRDALLQSFMAYAQSVPIMIQQGMDPSAVFAQADAVVKGIEKGEAVETVLSKVFPTPPPAEAASGAPGGQEDPIASILGGAGGAAGPDAGQLPTGMRSDGLPVGVAAGQAGMAPGGRPDLLNLLAGLQGGRAELNASVSRRMPA